MSVKRPPILAAELPTLAELIERGNRASEEFWRLVDEAKQERQTLLYNVRTVRKSVQRIGDGKPVTVLGQPLLFPCPAVNGVRKAAEKVTRKELAPRFGGR